MQGQLLRQLLVRAWGQHGAQAARGCLVRLGPARWTWVLAPAATPPTLLSIRAADTLGHHDLEMFLLAGRWDAASRTTLS